MTQKLPEDCFEWEKPSKFTSDCIKNYDEKSSTGYVFDVNLIVLKICMTFIVIYNFYPKE